MLGALTQTAGSPGLCGQTCRWLSAEAWGAVYVGEWQRHLSSLRELGTLPDLDKPMLPCPQLHPRPTEPPFGTCSLHLSDAGKPASWLMMEIWGRACAA